MRALLLATGMLTALRVPSVTAVSPRLATGALLLAPIAVLPLGLLVFLVCWGGSALDLPAPAVAFAALGVLAVGSRALHLDGLSDVADGLTASHSRERSLSVMKSGSAGPAGVVAVVVVLGVQAAALATYVGSWRSAALAGLLVCASRAALWVTCARPVPPARADGLGVTFTRRVPVVVTVVGWAALAALLALVDPVAGPVTAVATVLAVLALTAHTVRRFGGVTGDVYGAAIEVALAVLLVGLAAR